MSLTQATADWTGTASVAPTPGPTGFVGGFVSWTGTAQIAGFLCNVAHWQGSAEVADAVPSDMTVPEVVVDPVDPGSPKDSGELAPI